MSRDDDVTDLFRSLSKSGRVGEIKVTEEDGGGDGGKKKKMLVFPDNGGTFPADTLTRVSRGKAGADPYSLYALLHAVKEGEKAVGPYIRSARTDFGLQYYVSVIHRKEVYGYFTGTTNKCSLLIAKEKRNDAADRAQVDAKGVSREAKAGEKRELKRKTSEKKKKRQKRISDEEQFYRNRNTVMLSARSLSDVLDICKRAKHEFIEKSKIMSKGRKIAGERDFKPIIIVPAGRKSVISLANIKTFLIDGVLETNPGARPRGDVLLERTLPGAASNKCEYRVVDSVRKFTANDWKHVIAVFAQGAQWQFKNWALGSPAEIFDECKGIHVMFEDEKVNPVIKEWNVQTFGVSRGNRNFDAVKAHLVWDSIDKHMRVKFPAFYRS